MNVDTLDTVSSEEGAAPQVTLDARTVVRVWRRIDALEAEQRLHGRVVALLAVGFGATLAVAALGALAGVAALVVAP